MKNARYVRVLGCNGGSSPFFVLFAQRINHILPVPQPHKGHNHMCCHNATDHSGAFPQKTVRRNGAQRPSVPPKMHPLGMRRRGTGGRGFYAQGQQGQVQNPFCAPLPFSHAGLQRKPISAPYPFMAFASLTTSFFLGAVCPQTPEDIYNNYDGVFVDKLTR